MQVTQRIDKIDKAREGQKEQERIANEELLRMQAIVQQLFSTVNGVEFMRWVYQYSGIHSVDDNLDINPNKLIVEKTRKQFYIRCFRRFFNNKMISEIEKVD